MSSSGVMGKIETGIQMKREGGGMRNYFGKSEFHLSERGGVSSRTLLETEGCGTRPVAVEA
jgi:hypothetical protein